MRYRVILQYNTSCFNCGRAYALSFEKGGCEKIRYGTQVYDEWIDFEINEQELRKVTKCKFWIPAKRK